MRSFSLPSDRVPYFIGMSVLQNDRLAIVSPWISDITVEFPLNRRIDQQELGLLKVIDAFPETDFILIIRDDSHNDYVVDRLGRNATVHYEPSIHAKAIITDELAYVGSANITRHGIRDNIEYAQIIENEHGNITEFVESEISNSIDGSIFTD